MPIKLVVEPIVEPSVELEPIVPTEPAMATKPTACLPHRSIEREEQDWSTRIQIKLDKLNCYSCGSRLPAAVLREGEMGWEIESRGGDREDEGLTAVV